MPQRNLTERQREIIAMVKDQGFATIEALAHHFEVSAQSIRRDIIRLDSLRLLQRFHGGAGLAEATVRLGYGEKRGIACDAKVRIARKVAGMIAEGSTVFLDVGTTVEAVARELRHKTHLNIFTNNLRAALLLTEAPGISVFVLGGALRGDDGSLVGEATLAALGRFRFDHAVIGYSGFDEDGALMDFDLEKVAVKQQAIARAGQVLAVGDADKFGRRALVRVAPPGDIHWLVTDRLPRAARQHLVGACGLKIEVAG